MTCKYCAIELSDAIWKMLGWDICLPDKDWYFLLQKGK